VASTLKTIINKPKKLLVGCSPVSVSFQSIYLLFADLNAPRGYIPDIGIEKIGIEEPGSTLQRTLGETWG
jgi:hypothetical protein